MPPEAPTARSAYPRPALVRARWRNLNGIWELGLDPSERGLREGWERGRRFEGRVVVPYPIGAPLSGVSVPEAPPVVWYRRTVEIAAAELDARVRLHLGACDFESTVFVNGREVGRHRGGYTPIACEVGHALRVGTNDIVVRVEDPDTWAQPRGKQATTGFRSPVDYDAVTGIWQTVWLEPLPDVSIDSVWTRWSAADTELGVHVELSHGWEGEIDVILRDAGTIISHERGRVLARREVRVPLRLPSARLWSPDDPHLYQIEVSLGRGETHVDRVESYCGVREFTAQDRRLFVNGNPLYLRGVLDQGYFPGGWYAAATDDDLYRDVALVRSLGFNCARKHQKLEDPLWLYWADRLGLLVWTEMPSGREFSTALATDIACEWAAAVRRDRAHPSVMAWVPFNESWGVWNQTRRPEERALVEAMVGLTHALDPTRFVVGNDGWEYTAGDLWTLHLYESEGENVAERLARLLADPHSAVLPASHVLGERVGAFADTDVSRLPVLLTECGGIGYREACDPPSPQPVFAYGELPANSAELETRIRSIATEIAACPELSGFVWTQLTDVQQEINGLVTFERRAKIPPPRLSEIFTAIGR